MVVVNVIEISSIWVHKLKSCSCSIFLAWADYKSVLPIKRNCYFTSSGSSLSEQNQDSTILGEIACPWGTHILLGKSTNSRVIFILFMYTMPEYQDKGGGGCCCLLLLSHKMPSFLEPNLKNLWFRRCVSVWSSRSSWWWLWTFAFGAALSQQDPEQMSKLWLLLLGEVASADTK